MANLWSRGAARSSLMGARDRTQNPTPAAVRLLGKQRTKRHAKLFGKRRRAHRGNPLPAAVAIVSKLGILGGLGKRLKGPEAKHAERMERVAQLAERALNNDAGALAELERLSREFATQRAKDAAAQVLAAVKKQLADVAAATEAERATERRAAARETAAARGAREARFLEAGTTLGSAAAQALLGRGRALPRRAPRKKRRAPSRGSAFSF